MPETVECSQCQRALRIPEELIGRQVKCPNCGMTFTAGTDRGSPPEPVESVPSSPFSELETPPRHPLDAFGRERQPPEQDPYRQEQQFEEVDQWRKVRTGLTLTLTSVVVWALMIVLAMCMGMALGMQHAQQGQAGNIPVDEMIPLILVATLMTALGGIIWTVGQVMLAGAPERNGLKKLGLTSAGLSIATLVVYLVSQAIALSQLGNVAPGGLGGPLGAGGAGGPGQMVIGLLANLMQAIELFVLLAIMRLVAVSLQNDGLGRNVSFLIGLAAVLAVILAILTIMALMMAGGGMAGGQAGAGGLALFFLGLACLVLLLGLGFVIWFIVSLILVRNAVSASIFDVENRFRE